MTLTTKTCSARELTGWRESRIHAKTGDPMTRREAAEALGVTVRSYQRWEAGTVQVPGWLARMVRTDAIPTGYHRLGGFR